MAFKMKGINSLMNNNNLDKQVKQSSSPLFQDTNSETNSELANLDYTDTDFAGDNIAVRGEAVIPGQEVEKQLVPQDFDGGENNPEYQKKLAALETAIEQGKADKYQDQKVVRERDYTAGLRQEKGEDGLITYYKSREGGGEDPAYPMGDFLEGRMNYGMDPSRKLRDSGLGSGDKNTYLTESEALQLFKDSRGYHVDRFDNRNYKAEMKKANSIKKLRADYDKWVTQQTGKSPERLVSTPGYVPTKYEQSNLGDYTYSRVDE